MAKTTTIDTILPAGGRLQGTFKQEAGTSTKALIEINAQTLLEHAIIAVKRTNFTGRIAIIGPEEMANHPATNSADIVLQEGESGPANIRKGMKWLRENGGNERAERILILTTDLPFITLEAISDFINRCPEDADLCIPIYSKAEFMAAYPGCKAEFVRLKSGDWTTGCAFLVNPGAIERNWIHIEKVFAARKNQMVMARLLGAMMITRFVTRQLDIHHIERRCRTILGCSGVAVTGCDPALAFDIDDVDDYRYAIQHSINQRSPATCGAFR
jgi:CTP:molybdopterin cytidylyltransferase MocA